MDIPKEILEQLEKPLDLNDRPQFKPRLQICGDCNKPVEDRRVDTWRINENRQVNGHWKTKCRTCGLTKHPVTGLFELTPGPDTQNVFTNLHRKNNKKNK